MASNLYRQIMTELKAHLHKLNLSYEDVSHEIDVPVSTIKKWFAAKDGSMGRVHRLCAVVGISLAELLKSADQNQVHTCRMEDKQQKHFLSDYRAFEVYWCAVYERMEKPAIMARLKIDEVSLDRCLLRLDRLRLLRVSEKGKPIVQKIVPVRWSSDGSFMKKVFKNWTQAILRDASELAKDSELILQYFQISESSKNELLQDMRALEEKFARRTAQELKIKGMKLAKVRFLAAAAEGSFLAASDKRISVINEAR